jgi:hypothetical protein
MSTTIAELLINMGVSVEGAKAAEGEIKGVTNAAEDTDKKGGAGIRNFGATAGKALAAVGVAALAAGAAIFKLVDSVTSAADEVVKGSKAAGLGTEAYQRLSFAAKISGTDIKAISIASKTAARGLNDAATKGTGPMVEGLELVGLRIEDVIDLPFEKQLGVFADAISGLDTESEKLAASQLLLGSRSGPQLATLLAEGSAGIEALGDEAARTGGVLGGDALAASAEFQDSITRMKTVIGGVVNTVGVELIPVVEDIINQIKDWALANGSLMAQDIKRFVKQAIPVIKDIAEAVMFVVTGIKDLIGALGGFKPALAVATTATIAFKMAMAGVLGPIGLVAVGIAGLVTVVANLAGEFETVGERLEAIEERAQEIRGKGAGKQFANEEIKGKMWAKEDEFRAAELESKKWAKGEGPVAVKREREARRKSMNAQAELGKLEAENRRRLAGQAAEDASAKEKKTRGEARKVRSDRIAELEKAGKLKKGRGLEKRKNDFMMGKISESELIGKPKRRKGGGGSAPAKEPESDVTLAESLLAIRTGTADPKQLKQVIQQLSRKTPSSKSIKPTVAIDFFNFVITQNIKGANPTQIAKESAMAIRGEFEKQTAKAGQTVPTGIAR